MFPKKITALLTAAAMMFCSLSSGILQKAEAAERDNTVYITVDTCSGTPGSSVPVTVDLRTDYRVFLMNVSIPLADGLTPTPASPDEPDVPKAVFDMRSAVYAEPVDGSKALYKPKTGELIFAQTESFRVGSITCWLDIPEDAAVGTQYSLEPCINVLMSPQLKDLPVSVTSGVLTVTDQPAVTEAPVTVKPEFDITPDEITLTERSDDPAKVRDPELGNAVYVIPFTASENLDYIVWETDQRAIWINEKGQITGFNFSDSDNLKGTVTATAHFKDGTTLTDTVSVIAKNTGSIVYIDDPELIGPPNVVDLEPVSTAAGTTTTTNATTTTTKATITTTTAATTTTKATTTTTKATTTTTKAATTATKAATTTTKATTTTTKATTTTTKATTTTMKATTTTTTAATTIPVTTESSTDTTPAQTTAPTKPAFLTGDLNDDGKVGADDAQLALIAYTKRFAGVETGLTEQQFRAADVNGDHKLSADDAQFILIYYTTNQVAGKGITWAELLGGMPQPRPALRPMI